MVYVKIDKKRSIEKAISIFKRKVKESGILLELRERQEYKKPSAIKRKKKAPKEDKKQPKITMYAKKK